MTTPEQWRAFLQQWSDDWLATDEPFPAAVRRSRWLGFKPATEQQIEKLERRLGYRLPASYRAFLLTTNGWRRTGWMIDHLRPANKVQWLDVDDPQLLGAWETDERAIVGEDGMDRGEFDGLTREEYFTYDQRRQCFNREHFRQSLKIADPVDGDSAIYLLNPLCVSEDGEWEAWMHAHWIPGAERFPSFAHLMRAEYAAFRAVREVNADAMRLPEMGPYQGVYAPDRPRHAAEKIYRGRRREPRLTVEQLIAKLQDPSSAARKKAAQTLFREFKPHDPADERPHLVAPLARILASNAEMEVRAAAACMLGSYGTIEAIEPLVAALADADHIVAAAATTPLLYLSIYMKDPRIADGLLAYLATPRDPTSTDTAINILHHEFNDPRLAPIALRLIDDDSIHVQSRFGAAFALAEVSPKTAADELIARLTSPSAAIRQVAATAIRQTGDRRAIKPLRALLEDADEAVRQQAKMSLQFLDR